MDKDYGGIRMSIKEGVFKHIQELIESGIDIKTIQVQDLYKRFPDANQSTIRTALFEFKRKTKGDTSIDMEKQRDDTSIDVNMLEALRYMRDNFSELKTLIEKQKYNTSINTSISTSIDMDSIIKEYTGKESKTFSYNISIALHGEFEKVCKHKGLSLRKGLHIALALLVNLIEEEVKMSDPLTCSNQC